MPTTPTAPTAVPDFPELSDRATYNARAYAWAVHMDDVYPAEMLALATNAYNNAVEAQADTVATAADAVATAADRVQTGLDAVATAADRVQTGLDRTAADGSASTATTQAGIATTKAGEADASAIAAAASAASISGGPVTSVNGMTGVVTGLQAALVSGTSIKTVNSTSLLGSGDVAVQATLVSGTSIKTVNSTSLLGSGDIAIGSGALTLLATLTPTAAANVDFLSTFSSTYDNYLIIGQGLKPATTTRLLMRLANSGTADSASNYYETFNSPITAAAALVYVASADTLAAGKGIYFSINLVNANSASDLKFISSESMTQENATPSYTHKPTGVAYKGAAVSGFRLYWDSGSNFSATGKVRVYGYANT